MANKSKGKPVRSQRQMMRQMKQMPVGMVRKMPTRNVGRKR